MADENNEDDSWLYGNSNAEAAANANNDSIESNGRDRAHKYNDDEGEQPDCDTTNAEVGNEVNPDTICREERNGDEAEASVTEERSDHGDDDDSDSDDEDDVVVTIGDIKAGSNYNIKQRGNLLTQGPAATVEKPKANAGKFSIEEFESVGTISGQLAHEFSIDSLDEKPWRKPGADITDYFNYGFNEETWRAYCEKQKRMRLHESGVGLQGLAAASNNAQAGGSNAPNRTLTSVPSGDNSKYLSSGPPNIIAGPSKFPNRLGLGAAPGRNDTPSKENVIQVMTAERREYSRSKGKFESAMMQPPPNPFPPVNEPFYPEDNFYGYEPTQEQQWNNDGAGWAPSAIKELTTGPQMVPPPPINMNIPPPRPMMMGPPQMNMPPMVMPPQVPMVLPPQMPIMHPQHTAPVMLNREREERGGGIGGGGGDYRDHDDKRGSWRPRDKDRDYDRRGERERERVDRKSEESERSTRNRDDDSPSRDRRRDRERSDRYRSSSRRDRSRSRERSERRRRSKSRESTRDKDRKSRDKKKSHKKDKDDSD